jgi:methylmalonyl-CoA/ethylmalonyl-CoA epimerase
MKLHHIAIVVDSIENNLEWFCNIFGGDPLLSIYHDNNQKVKAQFIQTQSHKIELLEPLNDDSPVSGFLKTNGSGSIYHQAFEVENLDEQAIIVKENGGIVLSRTNEAWNNMEVMFAIYFNGNSRQLVEYVLING